VSLLADPDRTGGDRGGRLTRVEKAERAPRVGIPKGFASATTTGSRASRSRPTKLERALDPAFADAVHEHLTDVGFEYVTLDMAGYRTGSVSPGGNGGEEKDDDTDSDGTDIDLGRQYPR